MKVFLNNFLEHKNLLSKPYIVQLKEHYFSNDEGYHGLNSILVDAEQKYYTKVYTMISSFLFWVALKLVVTTTVNILVFWSVLHF